MRIIISEMKNTFDGDNGKLGTERRTDSRTEDKPIEMMQNEIQIKMSKITCK